MQLFSNYNFNAITTSSVAFDEIDKHIRLLICFVDECNDRLNDSEFTALAINIAWLKRFYETAERCVTHDQ